MFDETRVKYGIKKLGKKLLDETDKIYDEMGKHIEKLNDKEQVILAYLYIVKMLGGFGERERTAIIKLLNETNWEVIK